MVEMNLKPNEKKERIMTVPDMLYFTVFHPLTAVFDYKNRLL